jgi:sporulation-control protein
VKRFTEKLVLKVVHDKEINALYLQLMTMAEVESGDHEFNQPLILEQWLISSNFYWLQINHTYSIYYGNPI